MIFLLVYKLSPETVATRARKENVPEDKIKELLRGDIEYGPSWPVLRHILKSAGATANEIEVTAELYHECFTNSSRETPPADRQSPAAAPPILAWTGQNCTVCYTDIAKFASPARTDVDRQIIRQALYQILESAFADANISRDSCHWEDRGDGVMIILPPAEATATLIYPLAQHLAARLEEHNAAVGEAQRIQLRVAVDVGPVHSDDRGVNGTAIISAARLLEVAEFKALLIDQGASLGLIVSEFVHSSVVVQGHASIDPSDYRPVRAQVKEYDVRAWMYVCPPGTAG